MRLILPIIFLAAAGLIFFGVIEPAYTKTQELKAQEAEFDSALAKIQELKEVRERLTTKYNTFSPDELERLFKFLPDTVDNVRLILDISDIADVHNLDFSDITVETMEGESAAAAAANGEDESKPYASVSLSFTVSGEYEDFVNFMTDLEQSLRLVDVEELVVTKQEEDTLSYEITILTYWLK